MKRYYIGLANTFHDPAIAIVDDHGEVLFAEAAERHLQYKRAIDCPADTKYLHDCVKVYCRGAEEFVVATTWKKRAGIFIEKLADLGGALSAARLAETDQRSTSAFFLTNTQLHYATASNHNSIRRAGLNFVLQLRQQGSQAGVTFRHYPHHLTHAAMACFSSPFSEAVCCIIDGFGDYGSTCIFHYAQGRLRPLARHWGTASLGFLYGRVTELCGFDFLVGEEWKVMGLAAYGQFDDRIHKILASLLRVDDLTLRSSSRKRLDRGLKELAQFGRGKAEDPLKAANLAHTTQRFFAEIMTKVLDNVFRWGLSKNLVLGGGCALNSSFNGQALSFSGFERLHVPSAPADDGNAIGAALAAFHADYPGAKREARLLSPYLGAEINPETLQNLARYARLSMQTLGDGVLHRKVAQLLAHGKLVGWMQGRAEFGPRALGNRSILADPRPQNMKDRINSCVKFREEFRPFAPAILHEFGPAYFENYAESPYMERTLVFKDEVRDRVPAVVHVDGTGRLQTVREEWNPSFHRLIVEFNRLTGIPVLLNTSFNVMGKPIVHSIEDAVAVFFTSGLDVLVIGNCLIEKSE